jgi:methylated-DNA-protein-cysteine methyltransferase related protein
MPRTAPVNRSSRNRPLRAAFEANLREQGASPRTAPEKNAPSDKRAEIVRLIRGLPAGKVASYGAVARAAGWAGAARQVVRILRQVQGLPWHRVLGAGGAIKLPGESGAEQKFRLRMEGVTFRGARVDMKLHEFEFAGRKRSKSREGVRGKRANAKRAKGKGRRRKT